MLGNLAVAFGDVPAKFEPQVFVVVANERGELLQLLDEVLSQTGGHFLHSCHLFSPCSE